MSVTPLPLHNLTSVRIACRLARIRTPSRLIRNAHPFSTSDAHRRAVFRPPDLRIKYIGKGGDLPPSSGHKYWGLIIYRCAMVMTSLGTIS